MTGDLVYHKYNTPFGVEYTCKSGILHTCWNLRDVKNRAAAEGAHTLTIIATGVQHPKTTRFMWDHAEYQSCA